MPYVPVPAATGATLSGTRDQFRTNFNILQTDFAINHVTFDITDEGKHKFLQMPESGTNFDNDATPPTTGANEGAFFAKVGTDPAETNLFFRAESNGFEYQMTHVDSSNTTEFATNTGYQANHTGGWTFLPGGLIMQYGARSTPGTSGTITFPLAFPNAYFSITLTMSRNASTSSQTITIDNNVAVSKTAFSYQSSSANTDPIYWMAIGN